MYSFIRDRQDEPPVSHCAKCGGEIYSMDCCELNGSMIYCEHCAKNDENGTSFTGHELSEYIHRIYGGQNG